MTDSIYRQTVKNDFLRKSKNQRNTGIILLSAGAALTITGMIMINSIEDSNPEEWGEAWTGAGIFTIGALSAVASIPFFIASGNNKKKANKMTVGINMEKMMLNKVRMPYPQQFPALTARLAF
jgi:hypothetical protein